MKFVHYQEEASPHVLPLIGEIVKLLGEDQVRYVCRGHLEQARVKMGWVVSRPTWVIDYESQPEESARWVEKCPFMMCGLRDLDLFDRRAGRGLKTVYSSERWFKTRRFRIGGLTVPVPWWGRLMDPRFLKMACRFSKMLSRGGILYGAVGVHAVTDMVRMQSLISGNLKSLFLVPELHVENMPQGRVFNQDGNRLDHIRVTGYMVAPSDLAPNKRTRFERESSTPVRILWVGRMLDWKCVSSIIEAVRLANLRERGAFELTLVGNGPERNNLVRQSQGLPVSFLDSVPIQQIRSLMREHDVYVLASSGEEGWGAALNEAVEEGMIALGTFEAGASSTMLPKECLYHSGRACELADLLVKVGKGDYSPLGIGEWSAAHGAAALVHLMEELSK